jgi:hypothetical protein
VQVIKVAENGAVTITLTADETRRLRDDLDNAWPQTSATTEALARHLASAHPKPTPDRARRRRNP